MILPKTYEQLKEDFPMCKTTFNKYTAEIREEIRAGRYSPCSVIEEKPIRISPLVLIDYLTNRKALRDRNARKHVPPYDPADVQRNYPQSPQIPEIVSEVLERMGC